MSENPLVRLVQLVGGAAMLQGPIGYQVLGNLLIADCRSSELAGAMAALAVGSYQRSTAVQIALRIVVPAVVLLLLSEREAERLRRLAATVEAGERGARDGRTSVRRQRCDACLTQLRAELDTLVAQHRDALRQELQTQAAERELLVRSDLKADAAAREKALHGHLETLSAALNERLQHGIKTGLAKRESELRALMAQQAKAHEETLRRETAAFASALREAKAERDKLARETRALTSRLERLLAAQSEKEHPPHRTPTKREPRPGIAPGSADASDAGRTPTQAVRAPEPDPGSGADHPPAPPGDRSRGQ